MINAVKPLAAGARIEAAAQKWRQNAYFLLHCSDSEYDVACFYKCRALARAYRELKMHTLSRKWAALARKHLTSYSQRKAAAELGIKLEHTR